MRWAAASIWGATAIPAVPKRLLTKKSRLLAFTTYRCNAPKYAGRDPDGHKVSCAGVLEFSHPHSKVSIHRCLWSLVFGYEFFMEIGFMLEIVRNSVGASSVTERRTARIARLSLYPSHNHLLGLILIFARAIGVGCGAGFSF